MFMSGILWILTKISILKAIHNLCNAAINFQTLWILTKISILKAIHNRMQQQVIQDSPVNPH